jgi:NADP-dependent aldehyde dehydrogenase
MRYILNKNTYLLESVKNKTIYHFTESIESLFDILTQKVGRVLINGYPTGVEVCHSMVHGGPYPATTVPNSTSVGSNAIKRFVRPVCFQDFPEKLLPQAIQIDNPLKIWRLFNGNIEK